MFDPQFKARAPGFGESVALLAMLTSLVALSIDAVLPALPAIGASLGVTRPNDNQLVISLLFFGFGFGQMIYGPLSDSTGRKPAAYLGLAVFMTGCLLSLVAWSFQAMLFGRFLQGVGVAGPRTITIALVRDQYSGRDMARVMSFVMAIFILVPLIAPMMGQAIVLAAGWRAIFALYLAMAVATSIWFALRQPETLTPERTIPLGFRRVSRALREVVGSRVALGYTVATGLVFGSFLAYLNSVQQILQEQYALGAMFPLYFAGLAIALGGASLSNARLVMRWGMRWLVARALGSISIVSSAFLAIAWLLDGHPALWSMMLYLAIVFFSVGMLFGNLNALAMEPLGHVAGTGAAVVGSLSTFISLPIGTLIGQSYNGTVLPLVAGFAVLSAAASGVVWWIERASGGDDRVAAMVS
jgi:DHA1 family bicyclomycin/chloramphenicol resistance-like MFS transporter